LYYDKIEIETKTFAKNHKYELKLDRVGHDVLYESDSVLLGKIIFYFCLVVGLLPLILKLTKIDINIDYSTIRVNFIVWYLLALIMFLKPHQDDIKLVGGQNIINFYRNIPSESKVLEYLNLVISNSKIYLKDKYSNVDTSFSEETFINRLIWLREREIISESEFLKLKEEYNFKKLI